MESDLVVNGVVFARLELFLACFGVESLQVAIPTTDIDNIIYNRRGRMHDISR